MQAIYLLTAVDVRRATGLGTSRANIMDSLVVPSVKFSTVSHNPGGGVMDTNYLLPRLEAPEPRFSTKGPDLDIFQGMGQVDRWTLAGAYRRKSPGGGVLVPARCIIEGAITGWEPDESSPTEFQGCNHTFAEVTHVELHLDGQELFYVDIEERVLRVNGVDLFADVRRALGA